MSASVALDAPSAREPVIQALFALAPHTERAPFSAAVVETPLSPLATPVERAGISWREPADNLWLLSLKNYGLSLATFGIYHFWGRVETNRRMINAVHVGDKRLDYTANGREAFLSFLVGLIIAVSLVSVFVFLFVLGGAADNGATVRGIREFRWQRLLISLPLLFLFGSIAYRARHRVLRRTWVGSERFQLTGHAWSYAWQHFWTAFLVPLTAGWAAPWRSSTLEARKIAEMAYGQVRFRAVGDVKGLYKTFALVWFGGGVLYVATLVVLARYIGPELMAAINGLTLTPLKSWAVAAAAAKVLGMALLPLILVALLWRKAWIEHQISSIGFDGGRLQLSMPTGAYLAVALRVLALRIVSFGCFSPVARTRMLCFIVGHIRVEGRLPFDT